MTGEDHVAAGMPSAFGGSFDLQDFYRGFRLEDITPQNMQSWPYYKHVSGHWPEFVQGSSQAIRPATSPIVLEPGERFDLNGVFRDGKTYLQSLLDTQVKGFIVLRDSEILAEFYDNGFNMDDSNLLQSASKTIAGVVTHQLIDAGHLAADDLVETVLTDFAGTTIGAATVQQVLDHTSGARTLLDFHQAGTPDQQWEIEIGLQAGTVQGHVAAIKAAEKVAEPGSAWNYSDKNTDALALVAERVTGEPYIELLHRLFDDFGANSAGSIAVTHEGTASPCYGISMTTRDYALFHRWIALGRAPASYYSSAMDESKDKITTTNELAASIMSGTTYGSQTYYMTAQNVLHSSGSFGQIAMSDMQSEIVVAMFSDWANNAEPTKFEESRARSIAIIETLRRPPL